VPDFDAVGRLSVMSGRHDLDVSVIDPLKYSKCKLVLFFIRQNRNLYVPFDTVGQALAHLCNRIVRRPMISNLITPISTQWSL